MPDKGEALGLTVISQARHRSIERLALSAPTLAGLVTVPVLFNLAVWQLRDELSTGWAAIFTFWLTRLGIPGTVVEQATHPALFEIPLPHVDVTAPLPDSITWLVATAVTLLVWLAALRLREEYLPLRYFLLFVLFIQVTSLLFFAVFPERFPHSATGYIDGELKTEFGFLLLLPWGHALMYYVFDFSWPRKIGLTLMTLVFVVIAVPLQLTLHAYVLARCSLLLMPLLSFVLGPTLIVFGSIALYGWAMSWPREHELPIGKRGSNG
ncbi:hypothetical protein [Ralstonia sp. UBA689]|uniref:hypothetical protein n=1 Tax=Ralstonia sp. UBA689 TaxID=1947373 RepID=UPI0025F5781D|nr:hypothetical protein [Ralstonia sp. UBA689]